MLRGILTPLTLPDGDLNPKGFSLLVGLYDNELKFMTISQPGIKSNIFYCHTGLVLMNAIATQDCIHDPTFRHSSPSVFIRGDLMLKTQGLIYSTT